MERLIVTRNFWACSPQVTAPGFRACTHTQSNPENQYRVSCSPPRAAHSTGCIAAHIELRAADYNIMRVALIAIVCGLEPLSAVNRGSICQILAHDAHTHCYPECQCSCARFASKDTNAARSTEQLCCSLCAGAAGGLLLHCCASVTSKKPSRGAFSTFVPSSPPNLPW